jgi:hypothetical protein
LRADGADVQVGRRRPGPPLKTNVTGLSSSPEPATYETEKISAEGLSFFRNTSHFAVAV